KEPLTIGRNKYRTVLRNSSRFALDLAPCPRYGPAAFQPLSLAKPNTQVSGRRRQGRWDGKPSRVPGRAPGRGDQRVPASSSRPGGWAGKEARVVRASTVAWVGVTVGMALSSSAAWGQTPARTEAVGAAETGAARVTRANGALRTATDCYRRGDYELA